MTSTFKLTAALLLCVPALAMADTPADKAEKPLWEAGIGVGAVSFPEYRGSSRQRNYVLPVPYLIYRGDVLKTDRQGMRGVFVDSDRLELNLSLNASLPVKSGDHGARRGMPDLKPTVEFGPSLQINLWRNELKDARVDLRLPLRAAYTVTGGMKYVGLIFSPTLGGDFDPFGHSGWNLGVMAGPIFANARQHKHFYSVDQRYALPDRPAYSASGGYSGSQLVTSLSKRFDRYWVGGFVRYDNLRGAAFADSPLVERKHSWAAGLGVSWMLGESSQKVASDK
jgi:outer membrane scaffolding protein for murein synthesis (MipA/OmpV family)